MIIMRGRKLAARSSCRFQKTTVMVSSNFDLERVIGQVRNTLAEYYSREEKEELEQLDVLRILPRAFSTVVFLRARTSSSEHQLVMKTTRHHPHNKAITEKKNQAVVEFDILRYLYPLFQRLEGCSVPRPIVVVPDMESYVMDFVEGHFLLEEHRHARYFSSRKGFDMLLQHYFYCGKWLRHFQEFTGVRTAGPEALAGILQRCEHRLRLIEESGDSRCPKGLRLTVTVLLDKQLSQLSGKAVLISGRHSDFGPWNILVGPRGITVLDFLGYQDDPIAVDLLKMLMNFENQKRYLANSVRRITLLQKSFLEGFGLLPSVPEPVLVICETLHRVCSVWACVSTKGEPLRRRIEWHLCLKSNLEWLTNGGTRKLLWPGCGRP